MHDQVQKPPKVVPQHMEPILIDQKRAIQLADLNRFSQPMKFLIDYSNLVGDPYTCYSPGQTIQIFNTGGESYTCTRDDVLTSANRTLIEKLVSQAVHIYESTLSVMPISNLTIDGNSGCDDVKIDPKYFSPQNGINYILFLTTRPIKSTSTLAYASFCETDQYGRPTVGVVNVAPSRIRADKLSSQKQLGIVAHEICHALGFSSQKLFSDGFIKWTGPDTYDPMPPTQITVSALSGTGKPTAVLVTPLAVEEARNHFGCSELRGPELENGGSQGTAGSHWEKRIFQNEYMTGSETTFPILSNMTFSLLQDSGWYGVYNYTYTRALIWGLGRGCDFIAGDCKNWPDTTLDMGYRCSANSPDKQCTFDYRSIGRCNVQFTDELSDHCTFYRDSDDSRCDNPDTSNDFLNLDTGETRTPDSRCMVSNLLHINENLEVVNIPSTPDFRCYKTRCKNSETLTVGVKYLGYFIYYECPKKGGELSVIGFGGTITCIANMAPSICQGLPDDPNWPTITSISPDSGVSPGSTITVKGTKFTPGVKVIVRAFCDVTYVSPTELTVKLPGEDAWNTFSDLFEKKETIVVIDSANRTGVLNQAVYVKLDIGKGLGRFLKYNPLWAALIFGGLALIIIGLCLCIYYCCCKDDDDEKKHRR